MAEETFQLYFDPVYIGRWASQLGHDVEQFWQNLQDLINLEN